VTIVFTLPRLAATAIALISRAVAVITPLFFLYFVLFL
jgi:hypothetical protein